jgi:predicted sugar kinase
MAELYHGVLPAFQSADISALAAALSDIASHGFKRLEIERCGHAATSLLEELQSKRYACGISSVGPLMYVVIPKDDLTASEEVAETCKIFGSTWLGCFDGLNRPADVVIE